MTHIVYDPHQSYSADHLIWPPKRVYEANVLENLKFDLKMAEQGFTNRVHQEPPSDLPVEWTWGDLNEIQAMTYAEAQEYLPEPRYWRFLDKAIIEVDYVVFSDAAQIIVDEVNGPHRL